jgi:hypothetical protein
MVRLVLVGSLLVGCNGTPPSEGPPVSEGPPLPPGTSSPPPATTCPNGVGPADRWVVFDSLRDVNRDLYAVRANGCDLRRLTTADSVEQQGALSPDGTRLAFASDRSGLMQVHVLDVATGFARQVTDQPRGADGPTWTPDGRQLIVHTGPSLARVDLDGGGTITTLMSGVDDLNAYQHPTFVNGGARLLVDRVNQIDLFTSDGMFLRHVVGNAATFVQAPTVAADGKLVVYATVCRGDSFTLWIARLEGMTTICDESSATLLASAARQPHFGPDDALVFEHEEHERGRAQIGLLPHGGASLLLTPPGHDDRNPSWAPPAATPPSER